MGNLGGDVTRGVNSVLPAGTTAGFYERIIGHGELTNMFFHQPVVNSYGGGLTRIYFVILIGIT